MAESFKERLARSGLVPVPTPVQRPVEIPVHTGDAEPYAAGALTRELERLSRAVEGERNIVLNGAGFNLAQLVAAGALDGQLVRHELTRVAREVGLEETEIRNTLASSMTAGAQHPRIIPAQQPRPELRAFDYEPTGDAQADAEALDALVREKFPPLDWEALWADESEEEWIIEPLLPARRLVALYSAPKIGKSLLMLELAAAVALGRPILGVTPDRPRRVLYVDHENDPKADIRERLQAMGYKPADLANLFYLSFPTMAVLDSDRGGRELMAAVTTYGAEVVIIDTVSRAIAGEENENDTWLAFYRNTGIRLKREGIALIRLDHAGKDEAKGQRGGSAKSGDVDAVWRMSKVSDTTFRLDCEANRMPIAEKTLVLHREATPRLHHRVDAEGRMAAWRVRVDGIVKALDDLGVPADAGRPACAKALHEIGQKLSNHMFATVRERRQGPSNFTFGDDDE